MINKKNVDLSTYSTAGIHSNAKIVYFPESMGDVQKLLKSMDNFIILGGGSNTLFAEEIDTPIINTALLNKIDSEKDRLVVQSGVKNSILQRIAIKNNYIDLLSIYGLPGTIGGAVKGNATLFNDMSLFKSIVSIRILDKKGRLYVIKNFSPHYRDGNINGFIYDITLSPKTNSEHFEGLLNKAKKIRKEQPKGSSLGSVFKNPKGHSAGQLIDECGLKGKRKGGVKISESHGNFFINDNNGTYKDFIYLIDIAKAAVQERFNIQLDLEVKIVEK